MPRPSPRPRLPPGPGAPPPTRPRLPLGPRRAAAGGGAAGSRVPSRSSPYACALCVRALADRMAGAAPGAIMEEDYFGSAAEWGDEADGGQVRGARGAPDGDSGSPSLAGRPAPPRPTPRSACR